MSSVPAGKRNWKCPDCGSEVLLSVTQLDPMACDACLARMKSGTTSVAGPNVADAVAAPLGLWSGLPETIKLGIVAGVFVIGLVLGFMTGKATAPHSTGSPHTQNHATRAAVHKDADATEEAEAEKSDTDSVESDKRPEKPGPDYHWVNRRKRKDGSYAEGHWVKDR